jgi:molecular chaperone DnaK
MVVDAEKFAAEDHSRREAAEARNQADQLAYSVDKDLGEWADKVADADRDELKQKNDELKDVLKDEGADAEKIRGAADATMQVWSRIGQSIHQQAQAAQEEVSEGGPVQPEETDGDVVEGEIVDEGGA